VTDLSSIDRRSKLGLLAGAASRKRLGTLSPANVQAMEERAAWIAECREDLYSMSVEALRHLPPPPNMAGAEILPARHQRAFISKLEDVLSGRSLRVVIEAPPGSAKSTYTSLIAPMAAFQRRRGMRIIAASHTADLALDFSGKLQTLIHDMHSDDVLSYHLRTENKQRWYTTNGGAYLAAGVGQAIPGFRADLGIIDDPIKSRKAADSEADRKAVWEWFNGSFERRLTPGAPIIIILTRWHEDDLVGRLLQTQADQWEVVRLPAEAEEDDPLGREPGEWLWDDDDYGYGAELALIRDNLEASGETREWGSQYQQHPRPREGSIFKIDRIGVLPAAPAGGRTVRAYDLAATKDTGTREQAWTRGVKLTLTPGKRLVVESVVGCRGGPDEVERLLVNTAGQDGRQVRIGIPQDPGQAGKSQVQYLTKRLAGWTVESSPETGDKAQRAGPIASQVNVGNLDIVEGPWNRAFIDELGAFPAGATKDQVDALSRAYGMLIERGSPLILSPKALGMFASTPTRDRFAGIRTRNRFARSR
jgi:predicted phage terminase large subunit-like protein